MRYTLFVINRKNFIARFAPRKTCRLNDRFSLFGYSSGRSTISCSTVEIIINGATDAVPEFYTISNIEVISSLLKGALVTVSELETKRFLLYPNPVEGNSAITLKSSGLYEFDLDIINLNGQIVYTNPGNTVDVLNIELPNLSSWIYFIRLSTKSFKQAQKLIIK